MAIDISRFKKSKVLVIGDLIVDEYIWGVVEKVSKEAPVPIVNVTEDNYSLGGAGNAVNNLVALGAGVSVVGVAGADSGGKMLRDKFAELHIDAEGVHYDSKRPTTKKTRIIASSQQVLRVDHETEMPLTNKALNHMIEAVKKKIQTVDIVLISDYGKGTLVKPLLIEIFSLARHHKKITIVDPHGFEYEKYMGATIITPNAKEAATVAGVNLVGKTSALKAGTELLRKTRADGVLLTCGKDGVIIFGKSARPFEIEAQAKQVYDVAGARDTIISVLGLSLATGGSFKDAATVANVAAGIVVGKVGTATVTEKEMILELMAYSGNASKRPPKSIFDKKKNSFY